jgi:hypothetical protein
MIWGILIFFIWDSKSIFGTKNKNIKGELKMSDQEYRIDDEKEINEEVLHNATFKNEVKFIVCFLIIFIFGVFPWLIGVNFMVRWIYKLIF